MDRDLNVPYISTTESGSTKYSSDNPDNVDYDDKFKSSNNEQRDCCDSDGAHSGSSDIDESNGFQKVEMNIDNTDTLDTEPDESNDFQRVKIKDTSSNTPENEIEDNYDDDEEDGFQKVKMKDDIVNAKQPEFGEGSELFVPETSFQTKKSTENIDVDGEKIVTIESSYLEEAAEEDSLDQKHQDKEDTLNENFVRRSLHEGNVLRHRIAPEPSRINTDKAATAENNEDEIIPKGSKEKQKIARIRAALESDPIDVAALRKLAISPGGLINKNMRQRVWPLLINANTTNITPKPSQEEMEAMTKTYSQVVMDVNRSSSRFPPGIDDHVRMSMKDKLVDLIMRVMLKHHELKYYQGFHDVCITFLLCMDEDLAFAMVDKLAMGYMREYLDETMERTSLLLNLIYPLVNRCNPELCAHMKKNDLGTIFALSWVITWFSHVLGDIKRILRVFDFFLASHRMMPVYLSAAFVLYREKDVYAAGDEMGYIHKCLSTIPPDLPLESLLQRAGDLYLQYPLLEISRDPMLIQMNRQVYEHFNRVDSRIASRRVVQQTNIPDPGRFFVKATMWTVTAVVGVAVAVLYHNYMGQNWTLSDIWSSFS